MEHFEASITVGQCPLPKPAFSLVKACVTHNAQAGFLSITPFLQSVVPSSQAGLAPSLDGAKASQSLEMSLPLLNFYPDSSGTGFFFSYHAKSDFSFSTSGSGI